MTAIVNNEAEASVLGAVLMDGTIFKELLVQEAHFYYANHRQIFRSMKEVSDQNDFIDMVTVTTKLGESITQGGTTYLLEMVGSVASTVTMRHHERLIFDAYRAMVSRTCALQFAEDPTDQALDTLITKLQAFMDWLGLCFLVNVGNLENVAYKINFKEQVP